MSEFIKCQKSKNTETNDVIKSISFNQDEIFKWIIKLYCKNGFHLDPCYSKGNFYKNIPEPLIKYDLYPQKDNVKQCDSRHLPFDDNTIESIIFDPPFCFNVHGNTLNNISAKRFTMFNKFNDLKEMYQDSLNEFYRILKQKGILVFKCQDYTDNKTTMTHCLVHNWAIDSGFYVIDLFILLSKQRIYNPNLIQRHARKFHSYFWILKKRKIND